MAYLYYTINDQQISGQDQNIFMGREKNLKLLLRLAKGKFHTRFLTSKIHSDWKVSWTWLD